MKQLQKLVLILAVLLLGASALQASSIDILWYTGGVQSSSTASCSQHNLYKCGIDNLAATALSATGNTWNITYWDGSANRPNSLDDYDVMVVASWDGPWDFGRPDYFELTHANVGGLPITANSFGDRVMLTGQDADWHYLDPSHTTNTADGSERLLLNAINWAGQTPPPTGGGPRLGGVFLDAFNENSGAASGFDIFKDEGIGSTHFGTPFHTNDIRIPNEFKDHPINAGLTSADLSTWNDSAHLSWSATDTAKWTQVNADGNYCSDQNPEDTAVASCEDVFVTLVKAAPAGSTSVPEPNTLVLLGPSLLGLVWAFRRRKS